ncbi:MAG: hypothetical protein JO056_07180 [Alphaproteobacteria bacterium]|nr:hypothetical protein [Alphaproteobacteria bacterium]
MRGVWKVLALIVSVAPAAAAVEKPDSAVPAPASGASASSPAAATGGPYGQPSLNRCAAAMEGIAWNNCDSDADAYVYEEGGNAKPRVYSMARGKQRHDIPAGMHRIVIFCPAGWHPVDPKTGAVLEKPGLRFRCAGSPKP